MNENISTPIEEKTLDTPTFSFPKFDNELEEVRLKYTLIEE